MLIRDLIKNIFKRIESSVNNEKNERLASLNTKADKSTTYTKTETDNLLNTKQPTIDSANKLSSDLVDTNGTDNLFVTQNDIDYWNSKSDFDGYYDSLYDKPFIPTSTSDLSNDSGYVDIYTESLHYYYRATQVDDLLYAIEEKIPSEASASNQLADKEYVNDQVNSVSAYYITKNAQGDAFATKSELINASTYYSGGEVRTPTRNDYAIVLDDETHNDECTRYSYQNQWEYQYTVNESPMTQAQLNALNSGITSSKVSTYDGYASSKQDTINDLATIRSGASLGATAVQPEAGKGLFSGNYNDLTNKPTIVTYSAGTGIDITNGVISLDIANGDSEGF